MKPYIAAAIAAAAILVGCSRSDSGSISSSSGNFTSRVAFAAENPSDTTEPAAVDSFAVDAPDTTEPATV